MSRLSGRKWAMAQPQRYRAMKLRLRFEDTAGNELLDDTDVDPNCPIPSAGDIVFLVETSLLVKHREFYYDNLGAPDESCTVVVYCDSDFT